ncbi:MAG: efflux RND transporter periplasmic adaptor subunit [Planctomycetota bacterium]
MKTSRALTTACTLFALSLAPHALPDDGEGAHEVAEVTKGAFDASVSVQGRYASELLDEVTLDLERYSGELEVAEVLVTHGKVDKGQPILKLEAPDMVEQINKAARALQRAELQFKWAEKEMKISEIEREIAAERRRLSLEDTLSAHQRWDAFGKADAYKQAELGMKAREDRFADDAQELKQLEELYEGAKLASRTQDVVLDRARRSLETSKQFLEIARRNHKVQMEEALPNQERDMDNSLAWLQVEQANAGWRAEVAEVKQGWEVVSAREALEDAAEAFGDLEQDQGSLVIKAEETGVITAINLEPGEKVQANQSVAKLYSASKGTIKATLSAKDLRVVQEGDPAKVTWDWFEELSATGKVSRIAWQGQAGGARDATYEVTIEVDKVAAMIRPGMTARVAMTTLLPENTLSVPVDAVTTDDEGAFCMIRVGDGFERRAVSIGASDGKRVQIIKGLSADESVRVPAE